MYENLINYCGQKLTELDMRAAAGDQIQDYELQCADLLGHLEKSLRTNKAMAEAEGTGMRGGMSFASGGSSYNDGRGMSYGMPMAYGGGYMPRGMSFANGGGGGGRGGNGGGNSGNNGGGYSRGDRMDAVISSVNGAMADMPEDLRREAQMFLTRLHQSQGMM